jgi:uridylate kinase
MHQVAEPFIRRRAVRHLEKGRVVVFAGGTGNPFFTTDTAAALRASEIQADVMIKATKVDGLYTDDPRTNPEAELVRQASFHDVLSRRLDVMDAAAVSLCENGGIPLMIVNIHDSGVLQRVVRGEVVGSLIGPGEGQ